MKAKVVSIESSSEFKDGVQRFVLQFDSGEGLYNRLKLKQGSIGRDVKLDEELEVAIRLTGYGYGEEKGKK